MSTLLRRTGAVHAWEQIRLRCGSRHFSYPAVLLLLLACGIGVPLSEDLILITGGLVVAKGHGSIALMIAVGYLGVVASDLLLYRIGRKLGPRVAETRRFRKIFTPKRLAWLERHFHKHGPLTVFIARLVPGMRMTTFVSAGVSKMRATRFLAVDAIGALVTAPLLILLGWKFGAVVLHDVEKVGRWLGAAVLLIVLSAILIRAARKRRPSPWISPSGC